jgi:hypothetical protein
MTFRIGRRELITLFSGAAASVVAAGIDGPCHG